MRIAAAVFAVLVSFGSAEILLRLIVGWTSRVPRPVDADAVALPELKNSLEIIRPNVRGRFFGRLYESNSKGVRGPEVPLTKGTATYRILALGDSFTNGQGVRYEESYPALLAKRLNGSGDGRRYDAINLGVGGFNLHETVRRLRDLGLKYEPDLLIYGYTPNDIEGPHYRKTRKPGPPHWVTPSRFLNLLGDQWGYFRDLFWHAPGSYLWELDDNYFRNPPAWDYWRQDFAEVRRIADAQGTCLVVFLHPEIAALNSWYPYRPYYDAVAAVARANDIPVIDPFPRFLSRNPPDLWVNYYDHHPNPDGHAILATALADGLRDLPSRCWRGNPPSALAIDQE